MRDSVSSNMDEKAVLPLNESVSFRRQRGQRSRAQRFAIAAFATLGALVFIHIALALGLSRLSPDAHGSARLKAYQPGQSSRNVTHKVPLEAHIMSKCPDAKDCLHDLVVPAMQRISDKVDFKLSYIGTTTYEDDGVACMHGPTECLGNILELCAASLYPNPMIYLGFTMCLTQDYQNIPQRDLISSCALEHGVDFSKINECASSENSGNGIGLLRESVERSANASVKTSCTVRLDEKVRCVRDGGQWKDCKAGYHVDDLVRDVEKLYDAAGSF